MFDKSQFMQNLELLPDLCSDIQILGVSLSEFFLVRINFLVGKLTFWKRVVHQFEPADQVRSPWLWSRETVGFFTNDSLNWRSS